MSVYNPSPGTSPGPYHCRWCGYTGPAADRTSCPACGAPVDVTLQQTDSGWVELPPIKDMARLQFGQSFCQVEGKISPVADFKLAQGDGVYFAHHILLWKDPHVPITALPLRGGWKRALAGMPIVMTQAHGPGHIAFSRDEPGEMIALPLQSGASVDVREHVFMVATHSVAYDWFQSNIYFTLQNGNDTETIYPVGGFMDRFSTQQAPGLLLLHGAGNVFIRNLQPGQSLLLKPTALLFKDSTVSMNLHLEQPSGTWRSWRSWGERYVWVRLTGPGRVGAQSAFEPVEDPGYNLYGSAIGTTFCHW